MSIKIENTQIFGWEAAIRGARNPMNSWEKSDSVFIPAHYCDEENDFQLAKMCGGVAPIIKVNDYKLLMNLCKGTSEESKWRRMVHVQMDITAPLYWWKEFDTYKIGTIANSCSTMHKIHAKPFELEDFSCEHIIGIDNNENYMLRAQIESEDFNDHVMYPLDLLQKIIDMLNQCRLSFKATGDKIYWWQMIQLLPSSYNQRRTIDLNYEVLASQYKQRKDHKLDEWHQYCDWIKELPYSEFITGEMR